MPANASSGVCRVRHETHFDAVRRWFDRCRRLDARRSHALTADRDGMRAEPETPRALDGEMS